MTWVCGDCGKRYAFRPPYGLCEKCNARVRPRMDLIGWAGYKVDGKPIYLFQCPLCKRVWLDSADHDVLCNEVHPDPDHDQEE